MIEPEVGHLINEVGDDRDFIQHDDRVILIVENDLGFARFMLDRVREKGYKGLVTSLGAVALALTHDYKPYAILLDINLLDMQGWRVLERLKNDANTRHIPICVISTDDSRDRALSSGAMAFVAKPIERGDVLDNLLNVVTDITDHEARNILVVEPDRKRRNKIVKAIDDESIQIKTANDAAAAAKTLQTERIDCLIVSPEMLDVANTLLSTEEGKEAVLTRVPVIVYGDGERNENIWKHLSETCQIGQAHSPERLLDLMTFYLHRNVAKLPEAQQEKLFNLHQSDKMLAGKKVLIVDDDMRNIFALSSVLEEHHMNIISADNGRDAINILQQEKDIDIVLMDIMMPEMDGMETMREIRKFPHLKSLPIVAVTAKAMKGDREKCIDAGAWDYLSKPVDTAQMMTVLRAWLHR
jgi:CheY-like chemotaxis protein